MLYINDVNIINQIVEKTLNINCLILDKKLGVFPINN